MRKYIFVSVLMLFIASCGCIRKPGPTLTIADKWKAWLPDSAQTFTLKSSNGLSETYQGEAKVTVRKGSYLKRISLFKCEEGDTEEMYLTHTSSVNNYELQTQVAAIIGGQGLIIHFQDLYFAWDLVNDSSLVYTYLNRQMQIQKEEIDSMVVNGRTFHKVLKFRVIQPANLNPHEARTVFVVQHYGLIRYEEEVGVVWERE